jgi:hypothetical protein
VTLSGYGAWREHSRECSLRWMRSCPRPIHTHSLRTMSRRLSDELPASARRRRSGRANSRRSERHDSSPLAIRHASCSSASERALDASGDARFRRDAGASARDLGVEDAVGYGEGMSCCAAVTRTAV